MTEPNFFDEAIEQRIDSMASSIENRLDGSLTNDGKIDLAQLERNDAELFEVLKTYMMSKTWRDDKSITARDVAKLIEAQSTTTPLGAALEKLKTSFD
jgi:hypothetical protein